MSVIQNIPLRTNSGETAMLPSHEGTVLLIVDVAWKCGLAPQRLLSAIDTALAARA